jgi:hypothetical protein
MQRGGTEFFLELSMRSWNTGLLQKLLVAHLVKKLPTLYEITDRLCDLAVRVPGYRSRGPGLGSRRCQIF